ncbi:MAG: Uncharacterized protein XD91_0833 [Clostridiales bacterium 38_11]|nr:MAG: Uncharacterized protein XD91_0833 [Clostridiales bacterium 38_11]
MLVSACLLGINCKYNGENNYNQRIVDLMKNERVIPVCPEQLGGLTTPRLPCEIVMRDGEKRVIRKDGVDVTEEFSKGAVETLKIARMFDESIAILKTKSPSCGSCHIYDGSFGGEVIKGSGLTAGLLADNDIRVFDEDNFSPEIVDRH